MSYHKLMMENQTLFSKKLFEQLAKYELTSGQPKILEYLLEHNGAVQRDIACACHIEPATVTSLLFRMEKNNLVERRMKEGDRRFLCAYLTENGKRAAENVIEEFQRIENMIFEGFSKEEKEKFIYFLEKVNKNLKEGREESNNE